MDLKLLIITYILTFLFLIAQGEVIVFKELRKSQCIKKTLLIKNNNLKFYECPAEDYYSYITINGKRILFRGKTNIEFAYYHELGHLIYDNFLVDALIASMMVLPIFLLNFPWDFLGIIVIYIMVEWHKKLEERRADLFAHDITNLKYTIDEPEKNKVILFLHWLFWSHPPEVIRSSNEYYKKEVSLARLFLNSIFK